MNHTLFLIPSLYSLITNYEVLQILNSTKNRELLYKNLSYVRITISVTNVQF